MQIRCPTITIVIGDHQPQSVITASTPGNQAEGKIKREMTGEGGREGGKGKSKARHSSIDNLVMVQDTVQLQ